MQFCDRFQIQSLPATRVIGLRFHVASHSLNSLSSSIPFSELFFQKETLERNYFFYFRVIREAPCSYLKIRVLFAQAQLAEAVAQEEFKEAGRLKAAIKALEGEDVVREVVSMFEVSRTPWNL